MWAMDCTQYTFISGHVVLYVLSANVTKTKKFRANIVLINISAESQSFLEKRMVAKDPNQFKMFLPVYHLVQFVR